MSWQIEKRIWSKENWQWYSLLVHRGLSIGNGFEQECVDLGVRKEKTHLLVILVEMWEEASSSSGQISLPRDP